MAMYAGKAPAKTPAKRLHALEKLVAELSAEIAEQARLLDMSASREAKLLARIKELENGI